MSGTIDSKSNSYTNALKYNTDPNANASQKKEGTDAKGVLQANNQLILFQQGQKDLAAGKNDPSKLYTGNANFARDAIKTYGTADAAVAHYSQAIHDTQKQFWTDKVAEDQSWADSSHSPDAQAALSSDTGHLKQYDDMNYSDNTGNSNETISTGETNADNTTRDTASKDLKGSSTGSFDSAGNSAYAQAAQKWSNAPAGSTQKAAADAGAKAQDLTSRFATGGASRSEVHDAQKAFWQAQVNEAKNWANSDPSNQQAQDTVKSAQGSLAHFDDANYIEQAANGNPTRPDTL